MFYILIGIVNIQVHVFGTIHLNLKWTHELFIVCKSYLNKIEERKEGGRSLDWRKKGRIERRKEGKEGRRKEGGGEGRRKKNHTAIASGKLVYGNIGTREGNYPCRIKQSPEITPHIHTNLVMPQMALKRKEHLKWNNKLAM